MRWILIITFSILVTACSLGKMAYNHLDTVALWYISDYVRLEKDQKRTVIRTVDQLTEWHRSEELPDYLSTLTNFQEELRLGQINRNRLQHYQTLLDDFQQRLVNQLEQQLPLLLRQLNDNQYQQIVSNIDKEIHERRNQRSREERKENYRERYIEWFGYLNSDQDQLLNTRFEERQQSRQRRYQQFTEWLSTLDTASKVDNQDDRAQQFSSALLSVVSPRSTDESTQRDDAEHTLWLAMWQSSDAQQKTNYQAKLQEWRSLLTDLSED